MNTCSQVIIRIIVPFIFQVSLIENDQGLRKEEIKLSFMIKKGTL